MIRGAIEICVHTYMHTYILNDCMFIQKKKEEKNATKMTMTMAANGGRLTDAYNRKLEDFKALLTSSSTFMAHIHTYINTAEYIFHTNERHALTYLSTTLYINI